MGIHFHASIFVDQKEIYDSIPLMEMRAARKVSSTLGIILAVFSVLVLTFAIIVTLLLSQLLGSDFRPYAVIGGLNSSAFGVSCMTDNYCVATSGTSIMGGSGGSWSQVASVNIAVKGETTSQTGLNDVSCWSLGNCAAIGVTFLAPVGANYLPDTSNALLMTEDHGVWSSARFLHRSVFLDPYTISCWHRGDCVVAGQTGDGASQVPSFFVTEEHNGNWGRVHYYRPKGMLNSGDGVSVTAKCAPRGDCVVVAMFADLVAERGLVLFGHKGAWRDVYSGVMDYSALTCAPMNTCNVAASIPMSNGEHTVMYSSSNGRINQYTLPAPSSPLLRSAKVQSLSCWHSLSCLALVSSDKASSTIAFENGRWGPYVIQRSDWFLGTLACSTSGYCSALGYVNDAQFFVSGYHGLNLNHRIIDHLHQTVQLAATSCHGPTCVFAGSLWTTSVGNSQIPVVLTLRRGEPVS